MTQTLDPTPAAEQIIEELRQHPRFYDDWRRQLDHVRILVDAGKLVPFGPETCPDLVNKPMQALLCPDPAHKAPLIADLRQVSGHEPFDHGLPGGVLNADPSTPANGETRGVHRIILCSKEFVFTIGAKYVVATDTGHVPCKAVLFRRLTLADLMGSFDRSALITRDRFPTKLVAGLLHVFDLEGQRQTWRVRSDVPLPRSLKRITY